MPENPFRSLPSVNDVVETTLARAYQHDHTLLVGAIRDELSECRSRVARGEALDGTVTAEAVAEQALRRLDRELRPKLRTVINATGIVLHTNLGRAPIAEAAAQAAHDAAHAYLNLELDLETGTRS